jgi:hypothetical protein
MSAAKRQTHHQPQNPLYGTDLVQITEEYAMTIWIDAAHRQKFYDQLPLAILNAQAAGLAASEITAAMQVGDGHEQDAHERIFGHELGENHNPGEKIYYWLLTTKLIL